MEPCSTWCLLARKRAHEAGGFAFRPPHARENARRRLGTAQGCETVRGLLYTSHAGTQEKQTCAASRIVLLCRTYGRPRTSRRVRTDRAARSFCASATRRMACPSSRTSSSGRAGRWTVGARTGRSIGSRRKATSPRRSAIPRLSAAGDRSVISGSQPPGLRTLRPCREALAAMWEGLDPLVQRGS